LSAELTIALVQCNPVVGDVEGNLAMARRLRAEASALGADLVVFAELHLVGYPPEDLVLKVALCDHARHALEVLAADTGDGGPAVIIGAPHREPEAGSTTQPSSCRAAASPARR
jgi:NAD+ synthase